MSLWILIPVLLIAVNVTLLAGLEIGRAWFQGRERKRLETWGRIYGSYSIPLNDPRIAELEAAWTRKAA